MKQLTWTRAETLKVPLRTAQRCQRWHELARTLKSKFQELPLRHEACIVAHFPAPRFGCYCPPFLAYVIGPKMMRLLSLPLLPLLF